jgi:hypothetical protein
MENLYKGMVKWVHGLAVKSRDQRGAVNLNGILLLGIGMMFMGIAAYFIPVMLSGFGEALDARVITGQTATVVTTGDTSATVTLDHTPWLTTSADITHLTSDLIADTPAVKSITSSAVVIQGLETSTTRVLAFDEEYSAASQFLGFTNIIKIAPALIVLGFVVAGAVVGFLGVKKFA